jgi:hypothetical protein
VASPATFVSSTIALLGGGGHDFGDGLRLQMLQRPRLQRVPSEMHQLRYVSDCNLHIVVTDLKQIDEDSRQIDQL